jgi:hypothetical protein
MFSEKEKIIKAVYGPSERGAKIRVMVAVGMKF